MALTGILYLVATPIGNLEDMTVRAVKVLQSVAVIAAEDTRHTGKLLKHFAIATPQISYHAHNQQQRIPELLARLEQGAAIALVTDAGMPGISDPGTELVQASIAAGIDVVAIPGASAGITALAASGMDTQRFVFEGFLPVEAQLRRSRLATIAGETRTLILYEAPHRLLRTLADLADTLGADRPIAIARELTKRHEEFRRGSLEDAIAHFQTQSPRGEFTLILAGAPDTADKVWTETEVKTALQELLDRGISRSDASRQLAELCQLPRRTIYQLALSLSTASQ